MDKTIGSCLCKANRGIGNLRKLRHNTNLKTLKIVSHSLFASCLQYEAHLRGQEYKENQKKKYRLFKNKDLVKSVFKKNL